MPETAEMANSEIYSPENLESGISQLSGRTFAALGSSITYGFGSKEIAFPEMIAKTDSCTFIKQAISGMTLAYDPQRPETHPEGSYVRQLLDRIDPSLKIDGFVVQLSTNDAQKGIEKGTVSDSMRSKDQNPATITGAMEFILAYIRETWNCPVVFYINAYLDRPYIEHFAAAHPEFPVNVDKACHDLLDQYEEMIRILYALQKKWHFEIADLWNNEEIQNASFEVKDLLMNDVIHPRRAGDLFWYVPEIRRCLASALARQERV
jgi:lysophospholipase L1-like esterase